LRVGETMFSIMLAGGIPPKQAGWGMDRIGLYINGDAYEGSLYFRRFRGSGQEIEEYFKQMREYYLSLPPETFPNFARNIDAMFEGDGDERFEFGLDIMIEGLAKYAKKR